MQLRVRVNGPHTRAAGPYGEVEGCVLVTDSDLARQVRDVSRLTGEFVLRSGRTATEYFDKYQFESDPVLLD